MVIFMVHFVVDDGRELQHFGGGHSVYNRFSTPGYDVCSVCTACVILPCPFEHDSEKRSVCGVPFS